jgi:hypothetical protein
LHLSFVSLAGTSDIGYAFRKIPWRTKLASIRGSYYITFNV